MTTEEIQKKIMELKYDPTKPYAFISYSHRDRDKVYPLILQLKQEGYNIYIDTEFNYASSDKNWFKLMQDNLRNNRCRLFVCFYSKDYTGSYASLMELMTAKSSFTYKIRSKEELAFEIILLDNTTKITEYRFSDEMKQEKCIEEYESNFGDENKNERECLTKLLTQWQKDLPADHDYGSNQITIDEIMEMINSNYSAGLGQFRSHISMLMNYWMQNKELTGNYKMLSDPTYDIRIILNLHHLLRENPTAVNSYENQENHTTIGSGAILDIKSSQKKEDSNIVMEAALPKEKANGTYQFQNAYLLAENGKFTLLKGSKIKLNAVQSCPEKEKKLRETAILNQEVKLKDSEYELLADKEFNSLSSAACFVAGNSVNGKTAWKETEIPQIKPQELPAKSNSIINNGKSNNNPTSAKITWNTTISDIRAMMEQTDLCEWFHQLRDLSKKSAVYDVIMGALLEGSGLGKSYQKNYVQYVAQHFFSDGRLNASTWSSNIARIMNGSREAKNINDSYRLLKSDLTMEELYDKYDSQESEAFVAHSQDDQVLLLSVMKALIES